MATSKNTIDYLLDQLQSLPTVSTRKMFGEYAVYYDGKVVAFVCDDQLFLKPTDAGRKFLETVDERPAYPGSKNYFWIDIDLWEQRDWMKELIEITAKEVPLPKKKIKS